MMAMVMWLVAIGVRERNVDDVAVLIEIFGEANNSQAMRGLSSIRGGLYDDGLMDMAHLLMARLRPVSPVLHLLSHFFVFEDLEPDGASQLLMMHRPPPPIFYYYYYYYNKRKGGFSYQNIVSTCINLLICS